MQIVEACIELLYNNCSCNRCGSGCKWTGGHGTKNATNIPPIGVQSGEVQRFRTQSTIAFALDRLKKVDYGCK